MEGNAATSEVPPPPSPSSTRPKKSRKDRSSSVSEKKKSKRESEAEVHQVIGLDDIEEAELKENAISPVIVKPPELSIVTEDPRPISLIGADHLSSEASVKKSSRRGGGGGKASRTQSVVIAEDGQSERSIPLSPVEGKFHPPLDREDSTVSSRKHQRQNLGIPKNSTRESLSSDLQRSSSRQGDTLKRKSQQQEVMGNGHMAPLEHPGGKTGLSKVGSISTVRSKDMSIEGLSNLASIDGGETDKPREKEFVTRVYSAQPTFLNAMSHFVERDLAPIWNEISQDEKEFSSRRAFLKRIGIYLLAFVGILVLVLIFPISQQLFENLNGREAGNVNATSSQNGTSDNLVQANVPLSGLTFGLFANVFQFLWKYIVCLHVFPMTLRKWEHILYPLMGSLMHVAYAIVVRLPQYGVVGEEASLVINLTTRLSYVVMYYVVDFIALPLVFYKLNEFKGAKSNAVRSKKANPKVAGIWILLILTYSWMIVWIMGVFLTTYYELYTLTQWKTLTTILWVPALPLACWLAVDFAMQARKYSFGYLVAYLWLIEIIPYIAGSYIALVTNIPDYLRFLSSLGFIVLTSFFIGLIRFCSLFISDGEDTMFFIFPAQFFDNFFGALIFLSSYNEFFVPTILALLIWVTIRNSGLNTDVIRWVAERVRLLRVFRAGGIAGRVTLSGQAKSGLQYIMCDFLTNISVPILFYVQYRVYLASDPVLAAKYAERFGFSLEEINQVWILFGSTLGSRIFASLLTLTILRFKYNLFKKRCDEYKMKPMSFSMTFISHIHKNSLFFIIMAIHMMNICLRMFSNLFTVGTSSQEVLGNATSDGYLQTTLSVFWQQSVLTVLGDK